MKTQDSGKNEKGLPVSTGRGAEAVASTADDCPNRGTNARAEGWSGERSGLAGRRLQTRAALPLQPGGFVTTSDGRQVVFESCCCPLCGSSRFTTHRWLPDRLYGVPGRFRVVRCSDCRHWYLNPRPTAETVLNCYPRHYGPHCSADAPSGKAPPSLPSVQDARTAVHERPTTENAPPQPTPTPTVRLLKRVPGLKRLFVWLTDSGSELVPPVSVWPPKALELGCGTGRFASELQRQGWQVVGVEPSAEAASVARSRGLEVHVGPLTDDLFPEKTFDVVFAWMVVEHLHRPVETVRLVRRVLKPGGWFVFSVPNCGCWESYLFGPYWYAWQVPTHLQHFRPDTVRRLLQRVELECVSVRCQANILNWFGSFGLWLSEQRPGGRWGQRLLQFTSNPTLGPQLALAPLAKLLAALGQTGRMTVVARRPA